MEKSIAVCLSCILMAGLAVTAARTGFAEVPRTINFQGRLLEADGSPVADNTVHSVTISIYSDSSGLESAKLWRWPYTSVHTASGYFNVVLGDPNQPFPASMDFNNQYYLGIRADGEGADRTPLQPLNSVPYALNVARGVASDCWQGSNAVGSIANTTEVDMIDVPFTLANTANVVVIAKTRFDGQNGNVGPLCRIFIDTLEIDRNTETHLSGSGTDDFTISCFGLSQNLTSGLHHAYFKCKMTSSTSFPEGYADARMIVDAHYK